MLTNIAIRNFKGFEEVSFELGDRVVLVGPNNSGKTSALQALSLWEIGLRRWLEKRGTGETPLKRPGVTINRRDLIAVPVPSANLLWRDLHVREARVNGGGTQNVLIEIVVEGFSGGEAWRCGLEFDFANAESFYCRPLRRKGGEDAGRLPVPEQAGKTRLAYLPPMSGLTATETHLEMGAINVRIGEGRTAEVLRNLCYQVLEGEDGTGRWDAIVKKIEELFGAHLERPRYIGERGEIVLSYKDRGTRLDISSAGRGLQQTLLLLAHLDVNPASVLLLDEPDAHLEILRQRDIYRILSEAAGKRGSQVIAASHSEVLLNEAAGRDIVIAFVGKPHRIDDRGSQVLKALKEIGFDKYFLAEQRGWILYLEGATDLAILQAFASLLDHPAHSVLERPFVHYVANQPSKARDHFHGLREAKRNLCGIAIYDRLDAEPKDDGYLRQYMLTRREMENYLCQREVLLEWTKDFARKQGGDLFVAAWVGEMNARIDEMEGALETLGEPSPWGADLKVTDRFLDKVFASFFKKLDLPNLMRKTDYHRLAAFVAPDAIDPEIREILDKIVEVAAGSRPLSAGD